MSPRHFVLRGTLLLTLAACSDRTPGPTTTYPPGTALAIDGIPIPADEIEEAAGWVAHVDPNATPLQLRRLALANVIFPRFATRQLAGPLRDQALETARTYAASVEEGLPPGPLAGPMQLEVTGTWDEIGLVPWAVALETGPGRWSPLTEDPGRFLLVRLVATDADNPWKLTLDRYDFDYLPDDYGAQHVEEWLDAARLEIVDESWREAVPRHWIYRMTGSEENG